MPIWSRAAFSLLEVMFALSVLAVGILGVMANVSTVAAVRQDVTDLAQVQRLAATLAGRFNTARFDDLRTSKLPWSFARPVPVPFTANPTEATVPAVGTPEAGLDIQPLGLEDLAQMGLIPRNANGAAADITLRGLQVFVEYHRAISRFATAPPAGFRSTVANIQVDADNNRMYGLLCEANPEKPTTPAAFKALVNDPVSKLRYYLRDQTPGKAVPLGDVDGGGVDHSYDPVMVRLVFIWNGAGEGLAADDPLVYANASSGARHVTTASGALPSRAHHYELWTAIRPAR